MKVVQCWDDGVNDDVRLIEILRKHGAKASFNLNPTTHHESRQGGHNEKWGKTIQRLARSELNSLYAGFTIANHSMTPPGRRAFRSSSGGRRRSMRPSRASPPTPMRSGPICRSL